MQVAVYSTKPYDRRFLEAANRGAAHELVFLEERLSPHTAILQDGAAAACLFVNDLCDAEVIDALAGLGCRLLAIRSAGFNHVDLKRAAAAGVTVVRVPAYSPYAVAEHAMGLMLALNRKIHRAYNRVREGNFALDGLLGFDVHGKTAGIVGTGKIGVILARILRAMGCEVLGYDVHASPAFEEAGGRYVELPQLWAQADIISLHCPLTPETQHLVNEDSIRQMKPGVMLINTSRGGLIDTHAVIAGLKEQRIGYLGLDVYEQEENLFFENLSETIIQDDYFQRLLTFPNVLITGHQAYFTDTALRNIAETTIANITAFERGEALANQLVAERVQGGEVSYESRVGQWRLVIGHWSLVIGHWSLVVGRWRLVIDGFWSFDFWRGPEKNVFGDQNPGGQECRLDGFGPVNAGVNGAFGGSISI